MKAERRTGDIYTQKIYISIYIDTDIKVISLIKNADMDKKLIYICQGTIQLTLLLKGLSVAET